MKIWTIQYCLIFLNNYSYFFYSLACYPFEAQDPFILTEMPDVFFVSNQPSFQTSIKQTSNGNVLYNKIITVRVGNIISTFFFFVGKSTRLICVPSFSTTQTCVMLNLNTLECHPVTFKTFAP